MTPVSIKATPSDPTMTAADLGVGAGSPDATASGDFVAAMLQAFAPGTTPDDTAPGACVAEPAAPDLSSLEASALGILAPAVPLPALMTPLGGTPGGPSGVAGTAKVEDPAAVALTATSDLRMSSHAVGHSATPTTDRPRSDSADGALVATDGTHSAPAASTTEQDAGADAGTDTPTGPQAPAAPAGAATPSTTSAPGPVAPVPSSLAPAAATPAHHVTCQVIPEVTSLATRGDGTHRITLALKPEALGEVRVVMTVRDGSVHVRLAAGQDAQRALLEGSPELSRLLQQAGATETRVEVRDLTSTTPPAPGPSAQLNAGSTGPQDQHAGTRAHHPATDGTQDGGTGQTRVASGTNSSRSNEPVTRARTAGVDVTM